MRMLRRTTPLLAAIAASVLFAPAAQAAQRAEELNPTTPAVKWTGAAGTGLNPTWLVNSLRPTGQCGTDVYNFCDETLVHFTTPLLAEGTQLKFRIDNYNPAPSDFDLRVYESDATGAADAYLGSPKGDVTTTSPLGANDPRATAAGDFETKIV